MWLVSEDNQNNSLWTSVSYTKAQTNGEMKDLNIHKIFSSYHVDF